MKDSIKKLDLNLIPVILSGGSGSRLWPLSRASFPKQYLNLDDKNNFSLLQNTYLRIKSLKNIKNPIIISNEQQRFIVAEQMREINIKPASIILEPMGKNTAPAIALAALKAMKSNKDPILLILSSDHKIENHKSFCQVIEKALIKANEGEIVTFGIIPNGPETGYGYIECCDILSKKRVSSKIKRFLEKPNLDLAKEFIKDKHFVWNSGIFLFKASVILKELEKFQPEIIKVCKESFQTGFDDLDFFRINSKVFNQCPNIPIDIAVMEKTSIGSVFTLDAGWEDIGSWKSIWENSKKDKMGNTLKGKVIVEDSTNCFLSSEGRLITGIDLHDLIVIETNDAILVSNKNSTQKVKKIVKQLSEKNFNEWKDHKKNYRPWGSFTSIEKGNSWQVKKLEIKPNASISLQMHHHRSEHWIIVDGVAKVELNEKTIFLNKNQSTYIPMGSKHRITNPTSSPLILIEVQSGDYLGEDDIVRIEDHYGRINR